MAEAADRLNVRWNDNEVTPRRFLRQLDGMVLPRSARQAYDAYGYPYRNTKRSYRPATFASGRRRFAVRGQSPDVGSGNPFGDNTAPTADANNDDLRKYSPDKQQAVRLVREAQSLMQSGQYNEARRKAMQAKKLQVVWDSFELRPEQLLASIERVANTTTFTPETTPAPKDNLAAPSRCRPPQSATTAAGSSRTHPPGRSQVGPVLGP